MNRKVIRLFEMKKLTVGDYLVQAGIDMNKMYGKPEMASIVLVNSNSITLPGEIGEAPAILLNNEKTNVDRVIQHGDEITIQKGMDGKDLKVSLEELLGIPPLNITFNGDSTPLHVHYYVNDEAKKSGLYYP
ncbi:hypothetical protein ACDX78_08915 [Virgibacillus oceani]